MGSKFFQKRSVVSVLTVLIVLLVFTMNVRAAFQYEHDPMANPEAAADIIVNPDAVYGYSPNPDSGSLKDYAQYDWTDPEVVAAGRKSREEYHASIQILYDTMRTMQEEGYSTEEIAREVSTQRNVIRLEAYKDDPEGLEIVKKRNKEKYGNEMGPTPESLFEQYGSWETVIKKAFSSNPGMDACLGLYDEMYDTYMIAEAETIPKEETVPEESDPSLSEREIPKTGDQNDPALILLILGLSAVSLSAVVCLNRKMKKER